MSKYSEHKAYNTLCVFRWILLSTGVTAFIVGILIGVVSIIVITGRHEYSSDAPKMLSYGALLPAVISTAVGIVTSTLGGVALAIRDIAMNSIVIRNKAT